MNPGAVIQILDEENQILITQIFDKPVKVKISGLVQREEVEASPPSGYKESVQECHKVLDEINIPSATGEPCTDPQCQSKLGHRLRCLRDRYQKQGAILAAVRRTVQNLPAPPVEKGKLLSLLNDSKGH